MCAVYYSKFYFLTDIYHNVETGKMSIAVASRRSLALGQSADLYVLLYDNRPVVATSKPSLGHRDSGHLAGFYVRCVKGQNYDDTG